MFMGGGEASTASCVHGEGGRRAHRHVFMGGEEASTAPCVHGEGEGEHCVMCSWEG